MKKLLFLGLALMLTTSVLSQVGIGTKTPAPSSILELKDDNKALLITRVANTAAVTTPVNGMIIYDISSNCVKAYQNGSWSACLLAPGAVVSAYDCSTGATGTMVAGTPVSGVTQTITATVTTVGSYNITATANGVTFSGSGTYAGTGAQQVVLTATGTPTAAGSSNFTIAGTPNCSFTRVTADPSTNGTGVVSAYTCNTGSAGTMTVGTPVSGVTQTITATVVTVGTYDISTTTNGVTFAATGTFAGTGAQTIVLTATGTPTTAGTNSFALNTTPGCSFDRTVNALAPIVSSIDCAGAALTGTLTANTPASGVFVSVGYTGGNGFAYSSQLISSTGVTGLTASLNSGTLTNGTGGTLTFTISGTPNTSGVATFALTFGGVSCSFTANVNVQPAVAVLNCAGSTAAGTLQAGAAASGVTQVVPYTGGNGANYSAASFASSGVSGLTANLAAGTLVNGDASITFTITGTPLTSGTATFNITLFGTSCSFTRTVTAAAAAVGGLTCASATFNPSAIYSGIAYSGTLTVPYTGGNGGTYSDGSGIASSGITGLTATLQAGTLANGAGNLTYTVTGTASAAGTASFALSFGGQSCSVTKTIVAPPILTLSCGTATFSPATFTAGVAYSGTATVPYTGGNGTSYAAGTGIGSTGVTGLTATLQAGTLATGNGNLTYSISGTPSAAGVASFAISFGGSNCTLNFSSCGAFVSAGVFKVFQCYNLGAYATSDPNVPVRGTNGSYYQWGRNAPAATVTATTDAIISTWGSQGGNSNNGNWTSTAGGGPNNPCPAGFRVPSKTEWDGVVNASLNTVSRTGSWANDGNFTTAIHYGPSVSVKTLTLPAAGSRNGTDGTLYNRGLNGLYWSSSENGTNAWLLTFGSTTASTGFNIRTLGFSVRCVSE